MTRPWFQCPVEAWPHVAEAMERSGAPWPAEMMVADLRWWADQVRQREATGRTRFPKRIPGYRKMAARWNVKPHVARTTMQGRWQTTPDPGPRSSHAPAAQPARTSSAANAMDTASSGKISPTSRPLHAQSARKVRDTRVPPEPEQQSPEPEQTPSGSPPKAPRAGGQRVPPMPRWASNARLPKRIDRRHLTTTVLRAASCITGEPLPEAWALGWSSWTDEGAKPLNVARSATKTKPMLSLLKALDWPDLVEWLKDVELLALAARECPHPLFARHIRGEGWDDGVDRSRSTATLMVHTRWDDRLRAAREWDAAGRPRTRTHRAAARRRASVADDLAAINELGGDDFSDGNVVPLRRRSG